MNGHVNPLLQAQDVPHISVLSALPRLCALDVHNCVLRHGSAAALFGALSNLESLSLSGAVSVSHESIRGLEALTALTSLTLG